MKKYQVTFWTNVVLEEGEQQSFKREYETKGNVDILEKISEDLHYSTWLNSTVKPNHFFKTSTVTDFEVKEIKEEN